MTPHEPVYMVGTFRDNALHLSQLDSITQLRPQLPHLNIPTEDATDVVEDGRKFESRAVDVKLKNPREDNKQRNLNNSARLLHNIHEEPWQVYEYVGKSEETAKAKFEETMHDATAEVTLKATLNNSEWLDKMSAPRDSGKGGLLAKLRGREREKARRKKAKIKPLSSKMRQMSHKDIRTEQPALAICSIRFNLEGFSELASIPARNGDLQSLIESQSANASAL